MTIFPVNDYYRDHVVSGANIKQTPRTWVAALLISDPRTGFELVRIYEWKRFRKDSEWKRRAVITLEKTDQIRELISALEGYSHRVADSQVERLQERLKKGRGVTPKK